MKIPSGMAGTDARLARRSFAELRGRDARIEDAQYESVPVRSGAPSRAERLQPAAAIELPRGPGSSAVGTYLYVQRSAVDASDSGIAGIDIYV
ncbi:MAG: hypothetical protein KBG75_06915 [Pseudomonadales bacterium]|nr:hypothetical protein [Pseudomonadales bacterium]